MKKIVTEIFRIFDHLSPFAGLKPNESVRHFVVWDVLIKETDTIKVLRARFSKNEKLDNDENHRKDIIKIEKWVKMLRIR